MKTIITTLPIYDKLIKQTYVRTGESGHGIVPVISARHRLPSFQWLDGADGAASISKVETVSDTGAIVDITAKFTLPTMIPLSGDYFSYKGTTLNSLLDDGLFYLKITTNNAKVYYSEWFLVTCVFGTDTGLPPTQTYSEKYLIFTFLNTCDLGDVRYQDGFEQVLYLESETLEPSFPLTEEGQANGYGRFVRTFGRQTKKYIARTKIVPAFIVDVLNRTRLHSSVTLTDLVGDITQVYNIEIDHEWLFDDKYYARVDITFDYDETVVSTACCNL